MRLHEPHLFSIEMLKVGNGSVTAELKRGRPTPSRGFAAPRHRPKGGGTLRVANKFRAVLPRASEAGLKLRPWFADVAKPLLYGSRAT